MDSLPLFPLDDNPSIPLKRCTGPCGEEKPATTEFFHRNKLLKDGLNPKCKTCISQYMKAYDGSPERKKQRKVYLSLPETRNKIRAYRQRPEVRAKQYALMRDWRKTHPEPPERVRERHRKWDQEHREYRRKWDQEHREYRRKWNRVHPEYKRTWNREHREDKRKWDQEHREYYRKWRQEHPERRSRREYFRRPEVRARRRSIGTNYRARRRAVLGSHTTAQIQDVLKRQRYRCYYAACGHAKFQKIKGQYVYHIEHTFPLSRVVGTDIPANDIAYLVLACPTCNKSKNNKFPWEWPEGGRLL